MSTAIYQTKNIKAPFILEQSNMKFDYTVAEYLKELIHLMYDQTMIRKEMGEMQQEILIK